MGQPPTLLGRRYQMPAVKRVELSRPVSWLRAGLGDFLANPLPALAYGLVFVLGGAFILLASLWEPYLFMTALSGFFLVAPLLAAGLYELSRLRARGIKASFRESLGVMKRSTASFTLFGSALAVVAILWAQITAFSFDILAKQEIGLFQFIEILVSGEHEVFMATWFFLGASLALLVFAFSVISVPMIQDQDADFVTAITTSAKAFFLNLDVMVLWAGMIVLLVLVGFATAMVGLAFTMPIIGHATWHAYRELVK